MSCCRIELIRSGNLRGKIERINDISTYLTFPPNNTPSSTSESTPKWDRALLLLTEGHGLGLPNALLFADAFAKELNCPVIAPDQFRGDPWLIKKPDGWDDEKALQQLQIQHHPGTVDPVLESILNWINQPVSSDGFGGVKSLGGIGYCFGGRYAIRLLASGKIDAAVLNHPSFFTIDEVKSLAQRRPVEQEDDGSTTENAAKPVFSPVAIFAAEEDDIFPESKRRETEDALKQIGATWSCSTFAHTTHGFSIRGDVNNKAVRFASQAAFNGAVAWFNEHLGRD